MKNFKWEIKQLDKVVMKSIEATTKCEVVKTVNQENKKLSQQMDSVLYHLRKAHQIAFTSLLDLCKRDNK